MTQQSTRENKMIKLSKTFETLTQEDVEHGEASDRGFEYENEEFDFLELLNELDIYTETSDYPANKFSWVSTESETDCTTGEETIYSLHFVGPESNRKYWEKALKHKGLLK